MTMNHKRSFCTQQLKGMGKHFREFECINPKKLAVCSSRICKWTQHVKNTAQPHFFSRFCSKSHGAMIQRSKKKTDTDFMNRFFNNFRGRVKFNPQRLKKICTAALTRYGTVSMLGNGDTTCRDDE